MAECPSSRKGCRKKIAGHCIIVNNELLINQESGEKISRPGSATDAENIKKVFKALGFEVMSKKNLTEKDTIKAMEEVAGYDHEEHSCLFVFLLSHGEMGGIYSSKLELIPLSDILSPFLHCTSLADKPKVFIVQACRSVTDNTSLSTPKLTRNFLIAYATVLGDEAYRNVEDGSWYIQEFLNIIENPQRDVDFISMLTSVHSNMLSKYRVQVPEFSSTLSTKLYLEKVRKTSSLVTGATPPTHNGGSTPDKSECVPMDLTPTSQGKVEEMAPGRETKVPDKLKPGYSPESTLSPSPLNFTVEVEIQDPVYNMNHLRPIGYCVIIDNTDRAASTQDLTRLFQNQLGFYVIRFTGLRVQAIRHLLDTLRRVDHSKHCCFVLFIFSHGGTRDIYGTDEETLAVDSVLDEFSDTRCPSLVQKPKLFILQTVIHANANVCMSDLRYNTPSDAFLLFSFPREGDEDEMLSRIKSNLSNGCHCVESLLDKVRRDCASKCQVVCRPSKRFELINFINHDHSEQLSIEQPSTKQSSIEQSFSEPNQFASAEDKKMGLELWRVTANMIASVLNTENKKVKRTSKRVRVAQIVGSSISLVGLLVSIIGFILAPFTFGGSIGAVLLGAVIGVAGEAVSVIANITKKIKSGRQLRIVKKIIEDYEAICANFCSIIGGIDSHLRGRDTALFAAANGAVICLHVINSVSGIGVATAGLIYSATISSLQVNQMALTTVTIATSLGVGGVSMILAGFINVTDITWQLKNGSKTSFWLEQQIGRLMGELSRLVPPSPCNSPTQSVTQQQSTVV